MERIELDRLPSLSDAFGGGLVGAMRMSRSKEPISVEGIELPDVEVHYRPRKANPDRLKAFNELVQGEGLPPMFIHVMATPIIAALAMQPGFPTPVASMVQVTSHIRQTRDVAVDERLDFTARAGSLAAHDIGAQLDITAEARADGELVWEERSHYVSPSVLLPDGQTVRQFQGKVNDVLANTDSIPVISTDPDVHWQLEADEGRKYAEVSHDRRKIHTSSLTAKAFGFPRAFVQGAYTAARAYALLAPVAAPLEWEAFFEKPVLLPSAIDVKTWHTSRACGYRGTDAKTGLGLFEGTINHT